MEGAVFEQGLIHLIPRGWIRGIPGQTGSGCKLRLRDVHFGQKAWQELWKGFRMHKPRMEAPWESSPWARRGGSCSNPGGRP